MKKKIAILLAICLMLTPALIGCGSKPVSTTDTPINDPATQKSAEPEIAATPEPTPVPPNPSFSVANMDVSIGGAEWVTFSDEVALCIYLDYTNTTGMIIQPSNELSFSATQNGEELEVPRRGDTKEQRALMEHQHRRLFPGAVNRAAVYCLAADDVTEIVITFEDRNEDIKKEVTLDPANMWEIKPPKDNPPAAELASIEGFSGSKAHFDSSFSTLSEGDLEILRHEFVEFEGAKYVVVYFNIEVTGNMEEGETKDPYLMTNCFAFQDGMQLGSSTTQDDRMSYGINVYTIYDQIPEVAAHMQNIGPNEPTVSAIIYRLISDSDVSVAAAFNCSDFTKGGAFIGDTFPVE
ncbi:DUF5067 domain-containing protein [Eubacteriales bacterium OttesenSCG-928-K08]|nr:DUF5067 domain-containing protein [Eubacteriales bacterium OttesenSCG-928-K08]